MMLKSRVVTAVALLAILLLALFFLPPLLWAGLVVLMVMQGATEWSRLSKLEGRSATLYWSLTVVMMAGLAWAHLYLAQDLRLVLQLIVYSLSALLWLVVVPSWLIAGWKVTSIYLMALVGWAVLLPTGLAMMDLREIAPAPWLLLFVMGLVWVADSAAYFAGRRFGKNKLAPSISPGKTWEGVSGAILGVSVYVVLVWSFSPLFSERQILPPLLLTAWWWVVLAVMGDLFESAVKRQAGVKDSGALLPGHGGLLDRIDALTSTLPLAALALLFQEFN